MIAQPLDRKDDLSCGGRLVAADGRVLPLRSATLRVDAKAGLARVVLEQTFANAHAEPLAVTYALPLPHDGVVSGYAFSIGQRRVVGEVDRRSAARERYEQALIEGRTAALLEFDRSALFTQEIGNVPPGQQVVCEIVIDQRLRWLQEGVWEWRFPTVVAPRYLGHEGRVPDAEQVMQDVADSPVAASVGVTLTIRDAVLDGRRPESPSHAIKAVPEGGGFRAALDAEGARLDRDVVVRWAVAQPDVSVTIDTGARQTDRKHADTAYGLLTLVPPASAAHAEALSRDVIVLLDTSGSMHGEPLEQARQVVAALIGTSTDRDRLELIAFSSSAQRWRPAAVAASSAMRRDALAWLDRLQASGGTEMLDGIIAALPAERADAQRQIILVTDGLIGFESEVVAAIAKRLPTQSRVHTVGVGSAVNRTLTASAARAGRGVEVIIGFGENPDRAVQRLLACTSRPVVVGLEITGSALLDHAPARLPDLYADAPAMVALRLRPQGGDLRIHGRTVHGEWEESLHMQPTGVGEGNPAIPVLYAREVVEDLEMRRAARGDDGDIDMKIERIGLDFQIATRLTSWVAISETPSVDPREPLRRDRMPQALPYGLSIEGLGLRRPVPSSEFLALACMSVPEPPLSSPIGRPMMGRVSPSREVPRRDVEVPVAPRSLAWHRERFYRGRLVSRTQRQLVIEFTIDHLRGWRPGHEVEVTWDDGALLRACFDAEQSTRLGLVTAGCSIRVVLAFDSATPSGGRPVRVALLCGAERLVIEV